MTELIAVLVMTHMTILSVTIFLHRSQAHRSVELHPAIAHAMRFWLWLTTGMVTREWVAVHRQHHQKCEQPGDPHSPHVYGIWRVLFGGAFLYHSATKDHVMIQRLGSGTPNDWMERNVYSRYSRAGILLLLLIELAVFGGWGAVMWAIQMAWIPFHAAGVVNGLGHWFGYRNTNTPDRSRNIFPWDFWIGGECLHNNHHANAAGAKFSHKWWEFDIGWLYIRVLAILGLARIVRK